MMTKAQKVMDRFMSKLQADDFAKDNQPNKGPEMNQEFMDQQLSSYLHLLNSGIIEKTTCMK